MTKKEKQQVLIEILGNETVSNQETLLQQLEARGVSLSQGSLSRYLRELGVEKQEGHYRLPNMAGHADTQHPLWQAMRRTILRADAAGTLVVLHTFSGAAMAVAAAIDALGLREIAGCIAGDDTVFLATGSYSEAGRLAKDLLRMVEED